jgi:hypothetical protein
MISALKVIGEMLTSIIPYEFMRFTDPVDGEYWVGEYTEAVTINEDGYEESTLLLTGTTRGSWLDLEESKEKIKHLFPAAGGFRTTTDDGALCVFYENAFPVPTEEAELKRMQINLHIKQWKGMN